MILRRLRLTDRLLVLLIVCLQANIKSKLFILLYAPGIIGVLQMQTILRTVNAHAASMSKYFLLEEQASQTASCSMHPS